MSVAEIFFSVTLFLVPLLKCIIKLAFNNHKSGDLLLARRSLEATPNNYTRYFLSSA